MEIIREQPEDDETLEEWNRVTDDFELFGVGAIRINDKQWPWIVTVSVAEFIREEPLQTELWTALTQSLEGVPGVKKAIHDDRETWVVSGKPSGEALVRAASCAVDSLATRLRQQFESLEEVLAQPRKWWQFWRRP